MVIQIENISKYLILNSLSNYIIMKRICICLIVLMGILSQLNAQEQLKKSTNIPRPNDAIFKQQVEYKKSW